MAALNPAEINEFVMILTTFAQNYPIEVLAAQSMPDYIRSVALGRIGSIACRNGANAKTGLRRMSSPYI